MIRVAVSGAAGRMGADRLRGGRGRRRPGARRAAPTRRSARALADVLGDADVVVDFTTPDDGARQRRACLERGVHVVVGTTGFDLERAARGRRGGGAAQLLRRAQLRDRRGADDAVRAAEAAPHMPECEIIELHHDRKLDAPSGTAKRTAELIARGRRQRPRADPLGAAARASSPTRRSSSAAWARR